MWRPGHRRFQIQLVEGGSQGTVEQDKDKGISLTTTTTTKRKQLLEATQGVSLIEKSLILLSAQDSGTRKS